MAKVLVSLDDELLRRIDEEARREGLNRSALISRMAERDLGVRRGPGVDTRVRDAWRRMREVAAGYPAAPGEDSAAYIREMRHSR